MSAATGEIRAARRAGSSAAAIVTPKPSTAPSSSPWGGMTISRIASAPPPDDCHQVAATASPTPTTTPRATPATPRCPAVINMRVVTWRRVMPAARRSPTSRARSATVIASVLKIRNAPPKSATAATSAIVIRKSAVAASSRAVSSSRVVNAYGSTESRRSRAAVTAGTVLPLATPTSTRSIAFVPNRAWAAWSGTTMVLPAGSGSYGAGARIPAHPERPRPRFRRPVEGDRAPHRESVRPGERVRDESRVPAVRGERRAACQGPVMERRVGLWIHADHGQGDGQAGPRVRIGCRVRATLQRRRDDCDARRRRHRSERRR